DVVFRWTEQPMFRRFLSGLIACGLLTLLFTVWWFANRRIRFAERALGFAAAVGGGVVAALLSPTMVGLLAWLMMSLPFVFTAWTLWLLLARGASPGIRQVGLLTALLLTWGSFTLIRMDGLTGDGETVIHWRWTPTPEELYLAGRTQGESPASSPYTPI